MSLSPRSRSGKIEKKNQNEQPKQKICIGAYGMRAALLSAWRAKRASLSRFKNRNDCLKRID